MGRGRGLGGMVGTNVSTIMIVDDEDRMLSFLARCLTGQGHQVVTASSGRKGLTLIDQHEIDLIVLDLVMPDLTGLQVLTTLRTRLSCPPVIMLSAVTDVGARVQALDRGAVDFVCKPFNVAELVARVRRHLMDGPVQQTDARYLEGGGVQLDLDRRCARIEGKEVILSSREFSLLAHLMRRRGDVCRRDELLHDVWGLDFDPGSNVVEVCVGRIRHKLADPPIETVRGVGYCFYAS